VQIAGRQAVGPWSRAPNLENAVRALATFGTIPSDVIAARSDLDKELRKLIVRALKQLATVREARWLLRDVMGTESFFRPNLDAYESLHEAVALAYRAGLLHPTTAAPDEFDVAKTLEIRPRATSPDLTDEADLKKAFERFRQGSAHSTGIRFVSTDCAR